MKNNFKSLLTVISIFLWAVLCLKLSTSESKMEGLPIANPKIAVTLDFKDVSLKDVLKVFSMQSGLNFIASESVQDRKMTLYFDNVPIKDALDSLFKANNLYYEMEKDTNIFIVRELTEPEIETVTRIFPLKYATVSTSLLKNGSSSGAATGGSDSGILGVVTKLLSEHGSVLEDRRTNSLVVTDVSSKIPAIAETIKALDILQPQVMLEVEMLDVSKNTVDKIGIKFGTSGSDNILTMILTGAKRTTSFPVGTRKQLPTTFTDGSIDFSGSTFTVLLNFLRTQSDTRYLARPRILTLNNETAEIKIVTQETVAQTTGTTAGTASSITTSTVERIETGVSLEVTPQINLQTNEVTMFLNPKVKDTSTSTLTGVTAKDPEERSAKTLVRVKDGDTIIIGGLIRNEKSESITKLPILGDIPLLGWIFKHKNTDKDRERELLIFITPRIIRDRNTALAFASQERKPEGKEKVLEDSLLKAYKSPDREQNIASELDAVEKESSGDMPLLIGQDISSCIEREIAINSALNKIPGNADGQNK